MMVSRINAVLLIVNVAVLAAGGYYFSGRLNPPAPSVADEATEQPPLQESSPLETSPATAETIVITNRVEWQQLESEDYRTYIARLREIGCPEQTIRDIIIADLDKLFAPRTQALKGRRAEVNYWHPEEEELANNIDHRELARQERLIEKDKRLALQELLGVDLIRERLKQQGQEDYYERRLSFLPEEKRGALRQLLEVFDEREQEILRKEDEGELLTPVERAELRRLREERETQVASVLSPEEEKQYQLWMSPTANAVRQSIYGMDATEEESLKIYNLRRGFDETWGEVDADMLGDARRIQYEQSKAELESQLRAQLGEHRYSDLKRGEDPDFHHLNAVVSRYQLPRQKAMEVYELKRSIQAMRDAVQNDPRLGPEQKQRAIEEMNAETERTTRMLLGDKAFLLYLRRGQGQWLRH
jgi:hypothetical protein